MDAPIAKKTPKTKAKKTPKTKAKTAAKKPLTPDAKTEQLNKTDQVKSLAENLALSVQELKDAIDALGESPEAEMMRAKLSELLVLQADNSAEEVQRKAAKDASNSILGPNPMVGSLKGRDILSMILDVTKRTLSHPQKTLHHALDFGEGLFDIVLGDSDLVPNRGDRRFVDSAWEQNPVYRRVMQSYLLWSKQLQKLAESVMDEDEDKKRARFLMSLITDAVAPSNTLANPAALKRFIETGGVSVLGGVSQFIDDIKNNGGLPQMVDSKAFEVGKDLAATPGQIVYRSELLELIQYTPNTEKVFARPLLFVPPQINKYYVLDLSPAKSMMAYLVEQGQQMFAISWRNPTLDHRELGLGDYVQEVVDVIDVMCKISDSKDINVMGACSGGITASVTLAHLAAKKQKKVNALTLMVCMLDTDTETDMTLFASESSIEAARKSSQEQGFVDGKEMARAFAWLRPNDLIWNYWVNNYLLGQTPPAFDILYWNSDTTRMSAQLHSDYLDIFMANQLVTQQDKMINGTEIDLAKVKCDFYCLAGSSDHITPWKSCYSSTQMLGGHGTFVLSSSGHVQSLVNPPSNPKAKYFVNEGIKATADEWQKSATQEPGSWWIHWTAWLGERAGAEIAAPKQAGNKAYPALMDAPGLYVID